jgi:hypothetical protein
MGSGCSDLSRKKYICDVSACVESVKGITKNSASPSEGLVLKFVPGSNYEGNPISFGFMKWFAINVKNEGANALEYEIEIYKQIIRPLIDNKICTNFIRYLSSGKCDTDTIVMLLEGKALLRNGKLMDREQAEMATMIMYDFSFYEEDTKQRNLDNIVREFGKKKQFINATYGPQDIGVLINEAISPETMTLEDWLNNWDWGDFNILGGILFQISVAVYTLSLSGTAHNDLHLGNIWIKPHFEKITYIIGSRVYFVHTGVKVLLYDFDRSYSKSLGDNKSLEPELCKRYSQCNKLIGSKDIAKVIGCIYHASRDDDFREFLLDLLLDEKYGDSKDILHDSFSDNIYLFDPDTGKAVNDQVFEEMYSITHIMANIALTSGIVNEKLEDFKGNQEKISQLGCDINIIQTSFFNKETGMLKANAKQLIKLFLQKMF